MAVLPDSERAAVHGELMSALSGVREPIGVTKADLRAAVDAIDQWIDDNMAGFNQAIPEPARSALTAGQKARLFGIVARRRWEVL